MSRSAKHRRKQPGDRRLTVRAGNGDHLKLTSWIADECLAQFAIHHAAIRHDNLRHIEHRQLALADDRNRTPTRSFGGVIVTVFVGASDRYKHVAGPNLSPITRATRRTNIGGSNSANAARQKLTERHAM